MAAGLNITAPGRKSSPRLSPPLARTRSWISWCGSASPSAGSSIDADQLGHRQPEAARELAADPLGHERTRSLAGAVELDDVEAVVVAFDQPGQRAALAQRGHVAGRGHRSHRAKPTRRPAAAAPRPRVPMQVRMDRRSGARSRRLGFCGAGLRRASAAASTSSPRPAACTTATPRSRRSGSPTTSSRTGSAATSTRSRGRPTSRG